MLCSTTELKTATLVTFAGTPGTAAPEVPEYASEIFLRPGDLFWGEGDTRIRTVLGSCVSICLWHPRRAIGGMCHFMLPERRGPAFHGDADFGRYAEDTMDFFSREIARAGSFPRDYVAKVFGGGHLVAGDSLDAAIGRRNVHVASSILNTMGIRAVGQDTGGNLYRKVIFDLWSGQAYMKRTSYDPLTAALPVLG